MKNIILLLLFINCTALFAQSDIANTPTSELYGYYKKGQSFETIKTDIKNYEAILRMTEYYKVDSLVVSENDYVILWRNNMNSDGKIDVQIHYQFLIPFFKITIEHIIATYADGSMRAFTLDSKDQIIRELYADFYAALVGSLVEMIKPAKTVTKEQLREALGKLDKTPKINPK